MKKMLITMVAVLWFSLGSWSGTHEDRQYVNLNFTVWKLEKGVKEAIQRINTPIPEIFRESWIYKIISFDVTDGKAATKAVEKDGLRFVLIAKPKGKLTIQVHELGKELFKIVHNRPSTVDTIFYDSKNQTYLVEVTYTADDHPIGLLSPGILKK
jgi:hypothetical protein